VKSNLQCDFVNGSSGVSPCYLFNSPGPRRLGGFLVVSVFFHLIVYLLLEGLPSYRFPSWGLQSFPNLGSVLLMCLFFWLVFTLFWLRSWRGQKSHVCVFGTLFGNFKVWKAHFGGVRGGPEVTFWWFFRVSARVRVLDWFFGVVFKKTVKKQKV